MDKELKPHEREVCVGYIYSSHTQREASSR